LHTETYPDHFEVLEVAPIRTCSEDGIFHRRTATPQLTCCFTSSPALLP
jgi:hypothetical protein